MKKKLVSIMLCIVCVLGLAACGKTTTQTTDNSADVEESANATSGKNVAKGRDKTADTQDTQASQSTQEQDTSNQTAQTGTLTSTDWKDMMFALDGQVLTLPFDYSQIQSTWTLDMADYGYEDGYVMNKGDKTYSTIDLENSLYEAPLTVGFVNNGDAAQDILQCQIWSVDIDTTYSDTYPQIELPGGITWGSTVEQVVAAYGEPEDEPYRSDDLGYYSYEYSYDYSKYLTLYIWDDGGLKEVEYQVY